MRSIRVIPIGRYTPTSTLITIAPTVPTTSANAVPRPSLHFLHTAVVVAARTSGFDGRVGTLPPRRWRRGLGRWRRRLAGGLAVVASAVALAGLDLATGKLYRTATAASLHVTPARTGSVGRALVVFPGFAMSGELLS